MAPKARRRLGECPHMQLVRTYSDEARSGLNIEGRNGLRDLIQDVENGRDRLHTGFGLRRESLGPIPGRGRERVLRIHLQAKRCPRALLR